MKIKEGDKLPRAEFFYLDKDSAAQKIDTNYVCCAWCFY